jgi:uncharacterized damage-inducible protein DinB
MVSFLQNLLAHEEWANAVFFQVWNRSPSREHPEMRGRVEHILTVKNYFLGLLRGEQWSAPLEAPPPSFDELLAFARKCHKEWRGFAAALTPESLVRQIHVVWFPDPPCIITEAEAMVQVSMHAQHHRGQLMTRLKDHGGKPENVDWIIWLWQQKPMARWDFD